MIEIDPNHTDPIRLVLTVEQLRDPLLKAMGLQLSMKDRELAIANKEIADLQKQLGVAKRTVTITAVHDKPAEQPLTVSIPMATPKTITLPRPSVGGPWVLAALRAHGPQTVEQLAAFRGGTKNAAAVSISLNSAHIEHDGKSPRTYRLKGQP